MKVKAFPFGQTLRFVERLETGWQYKTLEPDVSGYYELPEETYLATRCFVTAEYCLEVLKAPTVLLGEDDHDDNSPCGVLINKKLHKLLKFSYRDFRYTGTMTVSEYTPEVNQFYCYLTKIQSGVGYIQPFELHQLLNASNGRLTRTLWISPVKEEYVFSALNTDSHMVFSKTRELEIPSSFFMVVKDNAPVRFIRSMYPALFENLSSEIECVQVLYSRAVSGYAMAPNVVVTSFDVFGDVLTSKVIFDAMSERSGVSSKYPPTLTEVFSKAF